MRSTWNSVYTVKARTLNLLYMMQIVKYFSRNEIYSKGRFKELIQDNHLTSDYWRVFRHRKMEIEAHNPGSSNNICEEAEKELRELKKELQKMIDENMDLKDQIQKLKNFLAHTT